MTDNNQEQSNNSHNYNTISGWFFLLYIISVIIIEKMAVGNIISKMIALLFIWFFIVFDIIWKNKKILINREIILVLIWFIVCLVSGFKASDSTLYITKIITVFQLGFIFIIGYSMLTQSQITLTSIYSVIITSVVIVIVMGFFNSNNNSSPIINDPRLSSTVGNANVLAIFGSYAFLFCMHQISISRKWYSKVILLFFALFLVYGVLKTESRKGILIIPIILIIYFILNRINLYQQANNKFLFFLKTAGIVFLMCCIATVLIVLLMNSEYFRRFERLNYFLKLQSNTTESNFTKIIDVSTYERRKFIKYGYYMWLDNPVLGTGLDNFKANINKYWTISRKAYAHNNYIELLSSTGLIGFIAYYGIYISLLIKLFKIKNSNYLDVTQLILINTFTTIILSLMILEFAMVSYYSKFVWLLLLIISSYSDRIVNNNIFLNHTGVTLNG